MHSILYVTDTLINSRTIQNFVRPKLQVETIGLNKVEHIEKYDLIIYEWNEDRETSLAEIRLIRDMCGFKDVPIILCANESEIVDAKKALSAGANEMILKPFNPELVTQKIFDALRPVGIKTEIDMEVVNPFLEATVKVMKTMTNSDATRKELFLKKNYTLFGDITGVMGISGETNGVVAITFRKEFAYKIVAQMVDGKEAKLSPGDVHDGIGELINMISGAAKTLLSETKYKFSISLPTIVIGHGHQISHPSDVPVIAMIFETDKQLFAVQLCVSSKKGKSADRIEEAGKNPKELIKSP